MNQFSTSLKGWKEVNKPDQKKTQLWSASHLSDLCGQLQILLLFLQESRYCVDVMVSFSHLAQTIAARHEVVESRSGKLRRQLRLEPQRLFRTHHRSLNDKVLVGVAGKLCQIIWKRILIKFLAQEQTELYVYVTDVFFNDE